MSFTLHLFILLRCGYEVQHLRVLRKSNGKYFLWVQSFNSITELVRYYHTSLVTRDGKVCLCDVNMDQVRHCGFMLRCTFI